MAHLSRDESLVRAFRQATTCTAPPPPKVFGVPLDKVSHDERRAAKVINSA